MNRNKIGVLDEQRDDVALERLLAKMSGACGLCDDLLCLDCAAAIDHDRCTRACPECAEAPVAPSPADDAAIDWDQAWETTQLLTELRGLDRLDAAIRAL